MHDPRVDPRPGDKVGHRERPLRKVCLRYTDACGIERVRYSVEMETTLKAWNIYCAGACHAEISL